MRRSTVLSLPLQSVFPALTLTHTHKCMWKYARAHTHTLFHGQTLAHRTSPGPSFNFRSGCALTAQCVNTT